MFVPNPFWHGTPVPPERFIGREETLRTISSRIRTGQSIAISGSPRSGKTSILDYLRTPEKRSELYGDDQDKLIFSYLDATPWNNEFNKTKFWQEALFPLNEYLQDHVDSPPSLVKAYQTCQENDFGTFVLERLFAQIKQMNKRLILIVDGFDLLLPRPALNGDTEFFGGLRSVTSRSQGALSMILAMNLSIKQLMEKVENFTRSGSPYFNFMDEVILGALSPSEVDQVLDQAKDRFTSEEKALMKDMAGGHPYLLQVFASCLWELHEENRNPMQRQQEVVKDFYGKVEDTLNTIWQNWPSSLQENFTSVALVQMEKLKPAFQRQGINIESLSKQLPRLKAQLEILKKYGFITETKDEQIHGGWRVYPKIFLHFIVNKKLKDEYRKNLPAEVWENLLTPHF